MLDILIDGKKINPPSLCRNSENDSNLTTQNLTEQKELVYSHKKPLNKETVRFIESTLTKDYNPNESVAKSNLKQTNYSTSIIKSSSKSKSNFNSDTSANFLNNSPGPYFVKITNIKKRRVKSFPNEFSINEIGQIYYVVDCVLLDNI